MLKWRVILFYLTTAVLGSIQIAQADEKLRIVADEWPPFSGAALPNKGLSVDITTKVLELAGFQVESDILPWERVIEGAKNHEYDVICSLFWNAELETFLSYSDAYYTTSINFVRHESSAALSFRSLPDMTPYEIAVGDGFFYTTEFDNADYLQKTVVTTTHQALEMLAHKRVDLTLDSIDVIRHIIKKDFPNYQSMLAIVEPAIGESRMYMAVNKQHKHANEIINRFNVALKQFVNTAAYEAMLTKHGIITD